MENGISQYSPSFSSTLLDAVYRSIDQGDNKEMVINYRETMRKKQNYNSCGGGGANNVRGVFENEEEIANFQRACMIEKWMEKKVNEKVVVPRKSAPDLQMKKPRKLDRPENSSWSSSDSSGGGGFFSSSELAESFPLPRPKPVRTGSSGFEKEKNNPKKDRDSEFDRRGRRGFSDELDPKPKHEGGFLKTKSRALKIYRDLKKVKQPISPGGKLAGFLNSLFTGAGKPKIAANGAGECSPSLKSTNASTCSSASSFSRSCLSKTPSSRGKSSSGGAKRSVRFSSVSIIADEDCQPCGHKSSHNENNTNKNHTIKQTSKLEVIPKNGNNINEEQLMVHVMEKNRRVDEVIARDLLRNYQMKTQVQVGREFEFSFDNLRKSNLKNQSFDDDDDDDEEEQEDDDAESYASSDLFELDNLSAIGMERYSREDQLPVYETTHRNGLIF